MGHSCFESIGASLTIHLEILKGVLVKMPWGLLLSMVWNQFKWWMCSKPPPWKALQPYF